MRYLSRTTAHSGTCVSSLWPLKWKSPTSGTLTPMFSRRVRIAGTCLAASSVLTVMRTISEPARASAATWSAVERASSVSVLVIDWTRMGASPPMVLSATRTGREMRREDVMGSFDGEAGDRDPGVRLEVELVVVVVELDFRRVADHHVERRLARDFRVAAGGIEAREEEPALAVAHLHPRLALEDELERAALRRIHE